MEKNNFIRGLPNHLKEELNEAEYMGDVDGFAQQTFPDSEEGRRLAKKLATEGLYEDEWNKYQKLLKEQNTKNAQKNNKKDSENDKK